MHFASEVVLEGAIATSSNTTNVLAGALSDKALSAALCKHAMVAGQSCSRVC